MSLIIVPIKHKTLIRADLRKVFDAMTTAEGLDSWFTTGSTVDRRVGGKLIFKWVNWGADKVNNEAICPILEVKVPERFVFKWWPDHYTTVEMNFEVVEEGTIVTVNEFGYQNNEEGQRRCLECATGWGEALTLLKFYIEHGLRY